MLLDAGPYSMCYGFGFRARHSILQVLLNVSSEKESKKRVSESRGRSYSTLNNRILIILTPK